MCGRFTLSTPGEALARVFHLAEAPLFSPRYNLAPSQMAGVVRLQNAQREWALLRWGLIPSWATDPKIAYNLINARSETASAKPSFRDAFRKRRCLVAADGFFEWRKEGKAKQPFLIRRADQQPFAFAGLWERWQPPKGDPLETFTILTTSANTQLASLHDRMPVILDTGDHAAWLDPEQPIDRLQALMRPLPDDVLSLVPVSSRVNSPKFDDPDCVKPLADAPQMFA